MSPGATTDRLSLTLPDWRTALKQRLRRPKRPNPWAAMYYALMVFFGAGAVIDLVEHHWPSAGSNILSMLLCRWTATMIRRYGWEDLRATACCALTGMWSILSLIAGW